MIEERGRVSCSIYSCACANTLWINQYNNYPCKLQYVYTTQPVNNIIIQGIYSPPQYYPAIVYCGWISVCLTHRQPVFLFVQLIVKYIITSRGLALLTPCLYPIVASHNYTFKKSIFVKLQIMHGKNKIRHGSTAVALHLLFTPTSVHDKWERKHCQFGRPDLAESIQCRLGNGYRLRKQRMLILLSKQLDICVCAK